MSIKIYETRPSDFKIDVYVVGCFVEADGKILFLKRAPHASEPNTWCIPGGKREKAETSEEGILRELFEETGIRSSKSFEDLGILYCSRPAINFPFHIFRLKLDDTPQISLSDEHLDYTWVKPEESKNLELISGGWRVVEKYFLYINSL